MTIRPLTLALVSWAFAMPISAHGQTQTGGAITELNQRQVAPDLYFLHDATSSNSTFLVTQEGVLVVDSRQHPRDRAGLGNLNRAISGVSA